MKKIYLLPWFGFLISLIGMSLAENDPAAAWFCSAAWMAATTAGIILAPAAKRDFGRFQ